MNDSGIFTAEEINEKFLNAIFNKYRNSILSVMKKIDVAAEDGNSGIGWNISSIPENEYYDIMAFLKKKGFNVILDKDNNLMNILW